MNFSILKNLKRSVVLTSLLFGTAAFPIGRSGDGKSVSSADSGFETPVPMRYSQTRNYKDGSLNIFYHGFSTDSGISEQSLMFRMLESIYPQIIGSDKQAAQEFLLEAGGSHLSLENKCIQAFRFETNSLVYTVFQWAPEKGVVVMGLKNAITLQSLNLVEKNLKLLPGACEWN